MKNKKLFIIAAIVLLGTLLLIPRAKEQQKIMQNEEGSNEIIEKPYSDGISLTITEPKNNATVKTSTIIINGKTSAGADIFVNDIELKANSIGDFSTQVDLDEGENTIVIAANDQEGNSAEKTILVTYETGQ